MQLGEMRFDLERCGSTWRDAVRLGEMRFDLEQFDLGRCGALWGQVITVRATLSDLGKAARDVKIR